MQTQKELEMVYLHVEQVNGRTMIVDQDGRQVAGVINFHLNASPNAISVITASIETQTRSGNGLMKFTTGA